MFNRLGACASADTHARYVQYRVEQSKQQGVMDDYPADAFNVVSIDNLDFIHSFARVYSGKLQLSWHGTTIQIVLPKPSKSDISRATDNTVQNKRTLASRSPASKQSQDIRSPITKKKRRSRTSTEQARKNILPQLAMLSSGNFAIPVTENTQPQKSLTINDFRLIYDEILAREDLLRASFHYVLSKTLAEKTLVDLPSFYGLLHDIPVPECSQVIYYGVLSQKCDNKETILSIINQMHVEFIATKQKEWVLLEGDQLTYSIIASVKMEYGNDLSWLIPIPGDWHVLKNFQEVLQKVYFDGGLLDLAKACGYQPNSIGVNFKRTHNFIIETWEALYRYFLSLFMSKELPLDPNEITVWFDSLPQSCDQHSASRNLNQLFDDVKDKKPAFQKNFLSFMEKNANNNKTWKLWKQYVFEDGFAYICMHLAIRTGNWHLRMGALKSMAALFTAFDRPNYQKLISDHIADVESMPQSVLGHLKQGGWTVSLTGRVCHSVGIDECHEMCINKDSKEYVMRPSSDNLDRKAIFMPIRAKAMKEFELQLYPEQSDNRGTLKSIYSKNVSDQKFELNVKCQVAKLGSSSLKPDCSEGDLCHLFSSKKLTPEQIQDLLNFRDIGQKEFEN